jgi:hypothetical protein
MIWSVRAECQTDGAWGYLMEAEVQGARGHVTLAFCLPEFCPRVLSRLA